MDNRLAVLQAKANRLTDKAETVVADMIDLENQINQAIADDKIDLAESLLTKLRSLKKLVEDSSAEINQMLVTILTLQG